MLKRYKAIIVEDLPTEAKFLTDTIEKWCPEIELLCVCETIEIAKKNIELLKPQLVFLDVELGSKTSFDLLKDLSAHPFKIIFTTAHAGYMLNAIRVSATDYLLKPYSTDELREAVSRAVSLLEKESVNELSDKLDLLIHNLSLDPSHKQEKVIGLTNKDGQHRIAVPDILFCATARLLTTEGNPSVRVEFRLVNGQSIIVSNTSVSHYEELLQPFHFARVSQPYLINMQHIKVYQKKGGKIIMKGYSDEHGKIIEEDIYISDAKKEWFDRTYQQFSANMI